ncbi:MAG TPA: sensor histidine kinase [Bryobacteraceae bacterium]|jgi:signal transduction histidine kinase
MSDSGTERTVSEIKRPLAQAAAVLSPHASKIRRAWRAMLNRYEPCGRYAAKLSGLYLGRRLLDLPTAAPRVYRLDAEKQGRELAREGVPVECAAAAVSLYAKACLLYFRTEDAQAETWRRVLARWASVYQFFLITGYRQQTAAERQELEEKVRCTERRFQALSSELGDAYEVERRRLAQDLHDEIGHDLIVLKLYTQIIGLDLKKGNIRQVRRKLKESISLIDHALQGVRHLVFDLGPAVWNEQGFIPAVQVYSRQFAGRTGIKVRFDARRLRAKLPARYETAIYKVLQGSLANIAAHSHARHVKIALSSRRDSIAMKVEDDGRGFDIEKKLGVASQSYGLRAMRDRIELLGGKIDFTSRRRRGAGAGTTVELQLPLREEPPGRSRDDE